MDAPAADTRTRSKKKHKRRKKNRRVSHSPSRSRRPSKRRRGSRDATAAPAAGAPGDGSAKRAVFQGSSSSSSSSGSAAAGRQQSGADARAAHVFDALRRGQVLRAEQLFFTAGDLDIDMRDEQGMTMLHWAASLANLGAAEWLLDNGADVNAVTPAQQLSALHYAVIADSRPLARLLLRHGANPRLKNAEGISPNSAGLARLLDDSSDDEEVEAGTRADASAPPASAPNSSNAGAAAADDDSEFLGPRPAPQGESAEERERREWHERLCDEAAAEDPHFRDWTHEAEERAARAERDTGDDETEDQWRQYIAREMARRREALQAERAKTFTFVTEEQKRKRREAEAEKARRAEGAKRSAEKIAAEEAERERYRREKKAAPAGPEPRRSALGVATASPASSFFEHKWGRFTTLAARDDNAGKLSYSQVPFPQLPPDGQDPSPSQYLGELSASMPAADLARALRREYLRWHPDKFMQTFGHALLAKDKDRVMAHVTRVAQYIARLKDAFAQKK
jgi:ankyrin repeat protein